MDRRPSDDDKPLVVRVKRKSFQCAIDALWIEIHERPLKRQLLDFGKLSISEASSSRVEEVKTKKILVEHMETINSTEETFHVLQSFLAKSSDKLRSKEEVQKGRHNLISKNIHDQILAKAKQSQEAFSRNARFNQIWKSRKAKNEQSEGEAINEMCQFYDIVRVDDEGCNVELQKDNKKDLEDSKMLAEYLPLLREVIPNAALEIEHDIPHPESENDDGYVYDYYTVSKGAEYTLEDCEGPFPLVQVEHDDDYWDGNTDSEYESDDSNVENHPRNEYPDEETSEDEEELSSNPQSDVDILTSEDEEKDLDVDDETSSTEWDNVHAHAIPDDEDIYSHSLGLSDENDMYEDSDFYL